MNTAVLAAATLLVIAGSVVVFLDDLRRDGVRSGRALVEAALPLLGVAALVWWSWASR